MKRDQEQVTYGPKAAWQPEMALEKVLEVLEPERGMVQPRWRYSRVSVLLLIHNQHVNVL